MPLIYHEGYSLGDSDGAGTYQLVKDTVGWTGKNLIKNGGARTSVVNGVTFVVNGDGSVTVNGTATGANANFVMLSRSSNSVILNAGQYILTGCPTGGGSGTYQLIAQATRDGALHAYGEDWGSGKTFTAEDGDSLQIVINITGGQTVNNLTFYPMIRRADIIDDTYEPYHESVETMYEEEIHGVNLLPIIASSQTINGVTFTVNADGSVKANGTATSNGAELKLYTFGINDTVVGKKLILSGCPTGGGATTYRLMGFRVADASGVSGTIFETGEGETFDYLNNIGTGYISLQIRPNYTANNLVFKPMLRKADIEDSTYRPYNEQAIQNQINAQGVLGAKNLLPNELVAKTVGGVTVTINDDNSVTLNGTATESLDYQLQISAKIKDILEVGKRYILTGCPANGSTSSYCLVWRLNNASSPSMPDLDDGDGSEFTWQQYTGTVALRIRIQSGYTCNNLVFKPMIRLASDPDDTYQPYAMTNRELTEKKINIADLKTVVSASSDFTDFKTRIASL